MTRVVISERFGGFDISTAAAEWLNEHGHDIEVKTMLRDQVHVDLPRDHLDLVAVVDALGDAASGGFAELHIIDIPDDVKWHVHEYDGYESLHEDHRSWNSDGFAENCT